MEFVHLVEEMSTVSTQTGRTRKLYIFVSNWLCSATKLYTQSHNTVTECPCSRSRKFWCWQNSACLLYTGNRIYLGIDQGVLYVLE